MAIQNFTNSSLVSYTKISPNKTSNRTHIIDTITIHCVVGQASVEALGNLFSLSSTGASSNYGIGYDGRVGLYVEEKDRSWCSSSYSNDNRAITIEVASDTYHPYAVKDAAYDSLIKLVADICRRNNIKQLKWKADKNLVGQVDKQNMTVHRWFANKACPGDYLYKRHGDIAKRVNELLGVPDNIDVEIDHNKENQEDFILGQEVKLISGATYYDGRKMPSWLFNTKLYVRGISGENITISTLSSGAITGITKAKFLIPYNQTAPVSKPTSQPNFSPEPENQGTPAALKIGEEISLAQNAKYTNGKAVPSWLYNIPIYVRGINGSAITISRLKTGAVTGTVDIKYIVRKNNSPSESKPIESKPVEQKPVDTNFEIGDVVKLTSDATYYNGRAIPSFVFNMPLYVRAIYQDNITISTLKTGAVTGMVNKKFLVKQ